MHIFLEKNQSVLFTFIDLDCDPLVLYCRYWESRGYLVFWQLTKRQTLSSIFLSLLIRCRSVISQLNNFINEFINILKQKPKDQNVASINIINNNKWYINFTWCFNRRAIVFLSLYLSLVNLKSFLYPMRRVVEGIKFLTRQSVSQSVCQSVSQFVSPVFCQRNSSETVQQNFVK